MNKFTREFNPKATDIAVCGSMAHATEMKNVIAELRQMGLSVSTPEMSEQKFDWQQASNAEIAAHKGQLVRRHFANIARAKAVLVCNYDKNDIANYIGTNTLMEMTAAFAYEKPIFLLNPVPHQNGREEILAMEPVVIEGNLMELASLYHTITRQG
ncbi:MAG: hypothetical protein ACM3JF_01310 [Sphaerimonospora mesophila]